MDKKNNDIFLARWLNNDLSKEELAAFEKSADFKKYQKIVVATDLFEQEEFDTAQLLARVKDEQNASMPKPKGRWIALVSGIAATLVLFAAFLFYFLSDNTISTSYGEQRLVNLPDGSEVILNAQSEVSFEDDSWEKERIISLKGEAFFKVEKGSTFKVKTARGIVEVLGTQFNVLAENQIFLVTCYEGQVRVEHKNAMRDLNAGEQFRSLNNTVGVSSQEGNAPGWISGESDFKSMPVSYVLKALEKQYNIEFEYKELSDKVLFTGSFPHNNKDMALKVVLGSMQIDYKVNGNKIILLKK